MATQGEIENQRRDRNQKQQPGRLRGPHLLPLELPFLFGKRGGERLGRGRWLPVEAIQELTDRFLRIESHLHRVGAHERAAEDSAGKLGDVVALEGFERGGGYLRARRNLPERDSAP